MDVGCEAAVDGIDKFAVAAASATGGDDGVSASCFAGETAGLGLVAVVSRRGMNGDSCDSSCDSAVIGSELGGGGRRDSSRPRGGNERRPVELSVLVLAS